MLNNKLGVGSFWFYRVYRNNRVIDKLIITRLIKNLFLKNKIFTSDIVIKAYPKYHDINIILFPINKKSYRNLIILLRFLKSFLYLLLKRNININIKYVDNIFFDINLLNSLLSFKIFNEPLKLKRIIKSLNRLYDTVAIKG